MKINNKIKQFLCGNWGKPNKTEQTKKLDLGIFDQEVPKHGKKKKKIKKEYCFFGSICPFCKNVLKELPRESANESELTRFGFMSFYRVQYESKCECGAMKTAECPACHRETWYLNGIYRHQGHGCGFEGTKKYE